MQRDRSGQPVQCSSKRTATLAASRSGFAAVFPFGQVTVLSARSTSQSSLDNRPPGATAGCVLTIGAAPSRARSLQVVLAAVGGIVIHHWTRWGAICVVAFVLTVGSDDVVEQRLGHRGVPAASRDRPPRR